MMYDIIKKYILMFLLLIIFYFLSCKRDKSPISSYPNIGKLSEWIHIELSEPRTINTFFNVNTNSLLIGSASYGFYVSFDKGITWEQTEQKDGYISGIVKIGIEKLLASDAMRGILETSDNGMTWKRINDDFRNNMIFCMDKNSRDENYIGTSNGVYYSTNRGFNWNLIGLQDYDIYSLKIDKNNIVYAGTDDGIFISNDNINWKFSGLDTMNIRTFVINSKGKIYVGTSNHHVSGDGIYISEDQGNSWQKRSFQIPEIDIIELAKNSSDYLFAAISKYGLFCSIDEGENWFYIGLKDELITSLYVGPNDYIYVGVLNKWLYKSKYSTK